MSQERIDIQYEEHLKALEARTMACTSDEIRVIAKVIAEENPDILLAALSEELNRRGRKIAKFKMALEREDA